MVSKVREEIHFVIIFLLCQLALFIVYYRDFETKFFPVVTDYEIVHVEKQTDEYSIVFVKFNKVRDCTYKTLQARREDGYIVRVDFLEDHGPNYSGSRDTGKQLAGPWKIYNDSWSDIQISVIHRCDIFGFTKTIMQKPKL